jgi:putative ABC transport system ATP-binding protein
LSAVIDLAHITKVYQSGDTKLLALDDVSISVKKGEMLAIMGQSGSGKSTLLNILGVLDRPTSGHYHLGGEAVDGLSDDQQADIRNRRIGFVFQSFYLLPKLSALENVMLPLRYRHEFGTHAKKKSLEMLEKFGIAHLHHHKPNQMSGGQQQRVAIARALVNEPDVILADEPTGALDSQTSNEVMALFKDLNQTDHRTIVVVTHDPGVAKQCERKICLQDGKVCN